MSTAAALAPSTAPGVTTELKPVAIPLPRLWIGFVIASLCLLVDASGWIILDYSERIVAALFVSLPLSLLGWMYWLFCIHRLHQILARATGCAYPISARRAVLLQLVPFYWWIWRGKWPRQMAEFINSHSTAQIKTDRPSWLLVLGSAVGTWALLLPFTSLRLFVLFGVTLYLTRKLKTVVTFSESLRLERKKQLDLALTAGLGAAVVFLFVRALMLEFQENNRYQILLDVVGVLVISVIVARFIEPLRERLGIFLGVEAEHPAHRVSKHWLARATVFIALAISNFAHGLLHEQLNSTGADKSEVWQVLLVGLLVPGPITYFWISGMRQDPRRAARFGFIGGAGIAMITAFLIAVIVKLQTAKHVLFVESNVMGTLPTQVTAVIKHSQLPNLFRTAPVASILISALLGLVGGVVIDKKWGGASVRRVVYTILGSTLMFEVVALFWKNRRAFNHVWTVLTHPVANSTETMALVASLSLVSGWCLGLLMHPATPSVFGSQAVDSSCPSEVPSPNLALESTS